MKKSTINTICCIANGLDARRHLPHPTNSMPTSVLSIKARARHKTPDSEAPAPKAERFPCMDPECAELFISEIDRNPHIGAKHPELKFRRFSCPIGSCAKEY